jgi:hypothetical protein
MEKRMDAAGDRKTVSFRTEFDHPLLSVDAQSVGGSAVAERQRNYKSKKRG